VLFFICARNEINVDSILYKRVGFKSDVIKQHQIISSNFYLL